ncbi:DUF2127 domain-containing protein [bacterium]|nr:DUF2127 domain-containing protein [bacterium]
MSPHDELKALPRAVTKRIVKEVERPDFGLRLIIIMKFVKATLLVAVGAGALALIHKDLHSLGERVVEWFRIDPANERVEDLLAKLTGVTTVRLAEISAGALAYSILLLVEGYGLFMRRVWAEWLTIIVTSSLIPIEIFELIRHRSVGKGVVLLINVVVVLYLARHHFLFVPGPIGRWLHAHFGKTRHESAPLPAAVEAAAQEEKPPAKPPES